MTRHLSGCTRVQRMALVVISGPAGKAGSDLFSGRPDGLAEKLLDREDFESRLFFRSRAVSRLV